MAFVTSKVGTVLCLGFTLKMMLDHKLVKVPLWTRVDTQAEIPSVPTWLSPVLDQVGEYWPL
jgi:hypothetical protein